jgi:2-polyprenyl-3-methyl-5-hydroxy-6-metoxy-1,4-benzoquinol methylase
MTYGSLMSLYDSERSKCVANLIPPTPSAAYALDLGCGTGIMAQIVWEKGYTYIGLDISKNALLKGCQSDRRDSIHFLKGDASSLPFKRLFKLVIALEIIEHLKDPCKLLVEINKVLLDDGYLLISTPNKVSLEGLKGKVQELILKKPWNAWNIEHRHVFSSFKFLSLFDEHFSIIEVWGYYFLPKLASEKLERKWWFGSHLRFSKACQWPLNMLGFQTIALLKKVRMK